MLARDPAAGTGVTAAPRVYASAMTRRHPSFRWRAMLLAALFLCAPRLASWADEAPAPQPDSHALLESIRPSEPLQAFLDDAIEALLAADAALRDQTLRVALIDLPAAGPPGLAQRNGDSPVYPASVPKLVYLMAAYAWRDQGLLTIDPAFASQLRQMIYASSNRATQHVVRRLTDTQAGPRLAPEPYAAFRERRHRVKRWLQDLGVHDLHTVHPTYDGGGDLYGRDVQFLEDANVEGSLPAQRGPFFNRQAMTANATARLLALLASDRALSPESSAAVREQMRRDPRRQPYLKKRIAGGADLRPDLEVFAKTGTWGPIFADAGIVRHASGHQLVVVVFLEGQPAYRGSFIAKLTRRAVRRLLPQPEAERKAAGGGV
jgi:beta-lactamase class A